MSGREIVRTSYRSGLVLGADIVTGDGHTDVLWQIQCVVPGCDHRTDQAYRRSDVESQQDAHLATSHPAVEAGLAWSAWEVGFHPSRYAASCSGDCDWRVVVDAARERDQLLADHVGGHDRGTP